MAELLPTAGREGGQVGWAILGFIAACIIFPPVQEFAGDNWVLLVVGLFVVGWILQIVDRFRFPTKKKVS
jgi:uncharacterized membrane protein YGL010W